IRRIHGSRACRGGKNEFGVPHGLVARRLHGLALLLGARVGTAAAGAVVTLEGWLRCSRFRDFHGFTAELSWGSICRVSLIFHFMFSYGLKLNASSRLFL
ncbi:MAG: hypothetical protein ACREBU_06655, partial [Nitrososphaera sp.]